MLFVILILRHLASGQTLVKTAVLPAWTLFLDGFSSRKTSLYIPRPVMRLADLVIDFSDINVWGIFAMPVGVTVCFGPAMLVWWLMERQKQPQSAQKKR